jgi:hypothetical protein
MRSELGSGTSGVEESDGEGDTSVRDVMVPETIVGGPFVAETNSTVRLAPLKSARLKLVGGAVEVNGPR